MRVYRVHRGAFDSWRDYRVVVDDTTSLRIADGEVLDLPGATHRLQISAGRYLTETRSLRVKDDEVVVIELTSNPKLERPVIRATVVTEDELQQKLLRFDRPPYVGGRALGLTRALFSIAVALGLSLATLGACVAGMIHFAHSNAWLSVAFLAIAGTIVWSFFGFAGLTGIRSLYYYFRLPPHWRH